MTPAGGEPSVGSGDFVVLVTAKAPVPGKVKTRLTPPLTPDQAAKLAAASLVDTIMAASLAVDQHRERVVLSMAGALESPVWPTLVDDAAGCTVIDQVRGGFGERLRDAHERAAALFPGLPVVQVGMDTPQLTPALLQSAAELMLGGADAVLGPASDGGWWLLGSRSPDVASVLPDVPMSSVDTGRRTHQALVERGLTVAELAQLADFDTYLDAVELRRQCNGTHFAAAFDELWP